MNMVEVIPTLSVIILNRNRLNSPMKRQILAEWIKNMIPTICCLLETYQYFRFRDTNRLKVKESIHQHNKHSLKTEPQDT